MSKEASRTHRFEEQILVHSDAAFNLARWLTGNDQDAEDMVQEACIRAYQHFEKFQGENSRAWLLAIVRNTCYTWLRQNRAQSLALPLDDEAADDAHSDGPEGLLQSQIDSRLLRSALEKLPPEFREMIILRELENLAYKEIASVVGIPIGTVMSRLTRARQQLKHCLLQLAGKEGIHEL